MRKGSLLTARIEHMFAICSEADPERRRFEQALKGPSGKGGAAVSKRREYRSAARNGAPL
jgi:hypothetical protein